MNVAGYQAESQTFRPLAMAQLMDTRRAFHRDSSCVSRFGSA